MHGLLLLLVITVSLPFTEPAKAEAGISLNIQKWDVKWGGRPRDPFVDNQYRVWFCGQAGNYIAYLNPADGQFKQYNISADTYPHNLIADHQDQVWYAGNGNGHIGKLNPKTHDIKKIPMANKTLSDPHTLVFNHQGNIWFTAQWGNGIGFYDVASGDITPVEIDLANARPYGIKISSQNQPWIVLLGTNKIATVDTTAFKLKLIDIPRADARPRRLEIDNSDNIWYVDYEQGYLGRYSPTDKQFKEWLLPGGKTAKPYGTAMDKHQIMWIALTGFTPNAMVGFDTKTETLVYQTKIPEGGKVRHMYYHKPKHEFWFGVDTGYIARARISPQ